jgi:heme/copper-type cytochrome/quinol oxidase subunit 2
MKTTSIIPLVNWGMGTILIGIFALVCIVLVLVVYNMASSDKKAPTIENEPTDHNEAVN